MTKMQPDAEFDLGLGSEVSPRQEGGSLSAKELRTILNRHVEWLNADTSGAGKRANLRHSNIRGADLQNAKLPCADLLRADLRSANLQGAVLRNAILQGANLRDARLRSANLQTADLLRANLRNADLRDASLHGTKLRRADLRNANLQGANLRAVNLRGADLRDADLRNADLASVDLRGVDLRGADLSTVRGLEAAIVRLIDLKGAILPERVARRFRGSNEREGTMAASEACDYREATSGNTPESMRTSIEVNDILQMQVRRLASSDQDAFEKLIQRLQRDGLVGLPEADKERLEEETLPEKGPVWRVRVNDEYRAFVLEKDADLEIAHLASVETLKKMRSLSASN